MCVCVVMSRRVLCSGRMVAQAAALAVPRIRWSCNPVARCVGLLASATIEANTLKAGTQLLCRFKARVTADNGATTLTARLRIGTAVLGGTALVASAATDTSSGDLFIGQFLLTARAAPGAAAECVGSGMFCQPAAAGGAMVAANLNATNFATNGALIIGITGEWNAADANAVQAEEFSVEIIG